MKKILIPWSGGIDSTALIFKNLDEGNFVESVYFNLINNETKAKRELNAINKILPKIKEKYTTFNFTEKSVTIELWNVTSNYILSQPPIWIFSLSHYLGNIDEVQLSYIMNDDAISYIDDIKNLYDSMMKFQTTKAKLAFPFIKEHKSFPLFYLDKEISKLTTTCEGASDEDNCGKCHACLKWKFYESEDWFPSNLKKFNKKVTTKGRLKKILNESLYNKEKEKTIWSKNLNG